jgi:UDP-glucose 4-epimerase
MRAATCPDAYGLTLNAGTGTDVSINRLATVVKKVCPESKSKIKHVKHIHPQSEIMKLRCNAALAGKLLGWKPATSLERGLSITRDWIAENIREGNTIWG